MEPKHDRTNIRAKRQRGAETWVHPLTAGPTQFPDVIGGIGPVFNVPGIEAGTRRIYARAFFSGRSLAGTTRPSAQLNAGPTLSDARINGVHRAGGSGTT
jgi:phosphate transport system substrate-binding protein